MLEGQGVVAEQLGGWGCFAKVKVEVQEPQDKTQTSILFKEDAYYGKPIPPAWETVVSFGVNYAFEHLSPDMRNKGYIVIVTGMEDNPVDTTSVAVAYAAARALWDALGTTPQAVPWLDRSKKCLCFPK
jgi:hypothetical protein